LRGAAVEGDPRQVVLVQKRRDLFAGRGRLSVPGQIVLIDITDVAGFQAGTVGRVFQDLPGGIPTGVIELVLDDDQLPLLVEGQKIQPFPGVCKLGKLLLEDQQVLAKARGALGDPLLQMLPLREFQIREAVALQGGEGVVSPVDLEHGGSPLEGGIANEGLGITPRHNASTTFLATSRYSLRTGPFGDQS